MHVKITPKRRIISVCIMLAFLVFFAFDLVKVQLIEGEQYDAASSSVSAKTATISAARGEIVDCYGKPLVYNDQGYSIIFDAAYFPTTKEQTRRNEIIISLIRLFESNALVWEDNLPLVIDANGNISYKEDSEKLIEQMKGPDMLDLNEYATAENCFLELVNDYSLQEYSREDARKIASVCYEMRRIYFKIGTPYTFAQDVPDEIVARIKENSEFYKGVDVRVDPVRKYTNGTLAPHILGRIGAIDADEYKEKKSEGYKITDFIGKSGIELAMEEYLKGIDGEATVYTDENGNNTTEITTPPSQGNTVVLTIDSGIQEVAQKGLEKALLDYAGKKGNMVEDAGAVVVLNCKDSSILASASYPTYDISTYSENAAALNTAPGSPLWNRALLSTYATGSTMKPSVAIAALEEGLIDEDYTVYCSGMYSYLGQNFKCEQAHMTRYVNVVNAIDESCNTFFYEVGKNMGIEKMNEYRTLFGLGAKTGCELGEASGVLDSPEYRASLNQKWLPGYTVQSAIGQAGNLFSPIQLANYCAAVANGGTRHRTHFVKSVKSYDYSRTVFENEAEIVAETGVSEKTLEIVRRGMLEVGTTGYCSSYFAHLPVQVAAKTGTSQEIRKIGGVSVKINNGFLIAFAPYDNPEIAVAVVGEGMTSGTFLASVVADIVEYYYGQSDTLDSYQQENVLIP
ncbi:MAG: penicillin-binding transpeptidase domain-containing protein [Acutalibacteraceae bacterium]|nr:penicillin-binding transpeptidase domain-containing protein [Acutalibacteraceae bacterium]